MIYAGIGSRQTPSNILNKMYNLAKILGKHNYILRSGGASGADSAFEAGCDLVQGKKEIFLPWTKFNNNNSKYFKLKNEAFEIAKKFHPAWYRLSPAAKKLMARNTYQILGYDCNLKCDFVLYWSLDTGGTQQALRIAKHYKIPIFKINENDNKELINFIYTQIQMKLFW